MIIRAMTWNIHSAIGPDGRSDIQRVIALIRRHRPDILAVQEVEARNRGVQESPFVVLKEHFGHTVDAETIRSADGAYGHMLLSRWPMEDEALHDLSVDGREPRTAISARVRTPSGMLSVIAAHLGLKRHERRTQASRLAKLVRSMPGPLIVMGDFNDWTWRGPVWRSLSPLLPARTRHRTFPARFPVLRLDEIFCRPAGLLGQNWRDGSARAASDHLPVIAELHLADSVREVSSRPREPALVPEEV
ncbi:endonuclease/exonuclease/phosphatase family protein [Teichococcus vastitatis]|uniref:Endonuclease/exonuclease/phosphatase family protein n=1 Tax=Teichococcus vastitatis TaxID=2307076 RepID=A0ABS9W2J8_9PROT|nr:endonuclease/exonuclease/phosphatase family protein [Pseudoroseomonas vastitatis]MCI0753418.1 endonuclease/exonuclease/phosphatase family protein [Pseudoroseomonas vastitatis]